MSIVLARSVGPGQLLSIAEGSGTLNTPGQDVTFLAEVDPGAPESCDAWDYGCGLELGVFVLVDRAGLVLGDGPVESHGHTPATHPHHRYVVNASTPISVDSALLVRDFEEMTIAASHDPIAAAAASLQTHRDGLSAIAVLEAAGSRARELERELAAFGELQQRVRDEYSPAVESMLRRVGLDSRVLEMHPEHLAKKTRDALTSVMAGG